MWLLEFHFAFSMLCLLAFIGLCWIGKEQLRKNGWLSETKEKKYHYYLTFFLPIVNILMILAIVVMLAMSKAEVDEYLEKNEDPENGV